MWKINLEIISHVMSKGSTELQNTERVAIHRPVLSQPCYWTDHSKERLRRKSRKPIYGKMFNFYTIFLKGYPAKSKI